jgi:O-antigen ligase
MTDKPRYQLRANSVALSRLQWWIVGVALLMAAVGAVLALSGSWAGTSLICLSVLIGAFTVIIARGREPGK